MFVMNNLLRAIGLLPRSFFPWVAMGMFRSKSLDWLALHDKREGILRFKGKEGGE